MAAMDAEAASFDYQQRSARDLELKEIRKKKIFKSRRFQPARILLPSSPCFTVN